MRCVVCNEGDVLCQSGSGYHHIHGTDRRALCFKFGSKSGINLCRALSPVYAGNEVAEKIDFLCQAATVPFHCPILKLRFRYA